MNLFLSSHSYSAQLEEYSHVNFIHRILMNMNFFCFVFIAYERGWMDDETIYRKCGLKSWFEQKELKEETTQTLIHNLESVA